MVMQEHQEQFVEKAKVLLARWMKTKHWDQEGLFPDLGGEDEDWSDIQEAVQKYQDTGDLRYLTDLSEQELAEIMNSDPEDLVEQAWQVAYDTEDHHAILQFLVETLEGVPPEHHLPILKFVYEKRTEEER